MKYQDKKYKGEDAHKHLEEIKTNLKELNDTFFEMMKHGVHEEFMLLTQKLIEYKVPFPELKLKDVKSLLEMEQFF